jgi:predicted glycogen debranching enzyme
VFMIHGENSTVIHYELRKNNLSESLKNVLLEIRPLIAFRDYHGTTHENGSINPAVEERSGLASVTPYQGLPSLHLAHNAIELRKTGDWYRNFEYDAERERGLDFSEDLFTPFVLRFDLHLGRQASIIASTEQRDVAKRSNIGGRRSHVVEKRSWHPPLRIVLPKASPLPQTITWFRVATRKRSSPATTGSATGVATP